MKSNKKLPNFLIVGAAKSGTTSLYYYLKEHPEICISKNIKETFFFTGKDFKDVNKESCNYGRYAVTSLERYKLLFNHCGNKKVRGEVCVAYLFFYKESIQNIKKILSDKVKIIIVLRNPIDRAFSNYLHHVRDGCEKETFEKALSLEKERKRKKWWWGYYLIEAGMYYDQVKAYLENFSEVKIYLYDDLKKDPLSLVQDIYRFLEVNDSFTPKSLGIKYNVSGIPKNRFFYEIIFKSNPIKSVITPFIPRNLREKIIAIASQKLLKKPQMKPETREYLKELYQEDVLKLQGLIKRDLTHWLK